MKEDVFLKPKEARRVHVMELLVAGKLTVSEAAQLLGLSERQVKRLKKGVSEQGIGFLAHKNRGRKPKHALPEEVRHFVVRLAQEELKGASCVHMAELLTEFYGITVSDRTIRRALRQAGIANPHSRKAPRKRRCRQRMPKAGLLVQADASPFAWLEERGPVFALHGVIDDATSMVLGLHFRPTEDLVGYLHIFRQMAVNHGIPLAFYSDRHSLFFSPKKLSIEEELAGKKVALTQLGRVLESLGINHIPASSPQAKGRVERLFNTLQHRLRIELRLAGISTFEEANAFLPGFIRRFNARFAVAPQDPEPAFRPAPPPEILEQILSIQEERKASSGSTISYYGKTYQLVDGQGRTVALSPGSKVAVLRHLDGSISALYQGKRFSLREFVKPTPLVATQDNEQSLRRIPGKPAPDHPWRKMPVGPLRPRDPVEDYFYRRQFRHY